MRRCSWGERAAFLSTWEILPRRRMLEGRSNRTSLQAVAGLSELDLLAKLGRWQEKVFVS